MAGRNETWRTKADLWRKLQPEVRAMRREPTSVEAVLWEQLRAGRLDGVKFRRQHPLDRFVVDFYAPEYQLAVEVDGDVHDTQQEQDAGREQHLARLGVSTVRFRNEAVLSDPMQVVEAIKARISELKR